MNSARSDFACDIVKFVKNASALQIISELSLVARNPVLAPTLTNFDFE